MNTGLNSHFDLKVGYSCNNKCIHCVVETNRLSLVESNKKTNEQYSDLIKIIDSEECKSSSSITITGGEPTIRRDFLRIIKYITKNYPDKRINIQTNGRNLGKYLVDLKALSNNITYTIAIHSMDEDLHNKIVNNNPNGTVDMSNPYKETLNSLERLKEVYGNFSKVARIEIVLSSFNYKNTPDTVEWLIKNGYNTIGISYPHLDGFYDKYGKAKIKEIGLSYGDLKTILPKLYNIAKSNKDVALYFEEVPLCMWRDSNNDVYTDLVNISSMNNRAEHIFVKFLGIESLSFNGLWEKMHSFTDKCNLCSNKSCCSGIWNESAITFGSEGISPITVEELKKIREC